MESVGQYTGLSMPIDSDAISIDGFACCDQLGVEAAIVNAGQPGRLAEVCATGAA